MADTPLPHQFTSSSEPVPPPPRSDGILPANAACRPAPAGNSSPAFHLGQWLIGKAIYAGILLGLWLVATFALYLFYTSDIRNAMGFALVFTLVAAFFVRSLFPTTADKVLAASTSPSPQQTDSFREIVETVVFVVVLVLLLKSFAAEAFVIPTGSMAQTLLGYQKEVTCPQCGHKFPVNCSSEADPSDGAPTFVQACTCPNCRQKIVFLRPGRSAKEMGLPEGVVAIPDPGWNSGDRVLVAKFVYDLLHRLPDRLDVVVFKFPGDAPTEPFPSSSGPVKKHVPMNYIKRLIGLPGETIAIHRGKLYYLSADKGLSYDDLEKAEGDPNKLAMLWRYPHMHVDDQRAKELFEKKDGGFEIIRKKPDTLLAMMRLVYDNDRQAKDLADREGFQRWRPASESWSASGKTAFQYKPSGTDTSWLRYQHILPGPDRHSPESPRLITDFMGYNTWEGEKGHSSPGQNWASDLIVECQVDVDKGDGTFTLELSRGPDRFSAEFDLSDGTCTLFRITDKKEPKKLDSKPSRLKGKGSYHVRFANVDDRLTVWVDDRLVFGDGVPYDMANEPPLEPTKQNDLDRPVSIGAKGVAMTVNHVKVFRDTYYTTSRNRNPAAVDVTELVPSDPETFKHVAAAPVATFYVQPGHFLCLGDNSPESSDGRSWGLVPQRLMLGRALLVYYPFSRAGRIR